ncbi:MAG TPA: ABC transporter ATP-binding protein [Flavobacteriales bacterium]|nr:ABC transporter ATP-binding protein [Flavobacteriales bacterium]
MLYVSDIHKSFGNNHVLRNFNLSIAKGEFYSLLGTNGAGKSTSINIIAQLLKPDSGSIEVAGLKAVSGANTEIKKLLGVVPQEIALYEELSAWENMVFWGKLNRVSKIHIVERGKYILERFGLYERRHEKIKTYSGGMKRRINIAAALLHDPELILMDEPTVGIDPQSRNNIYEFILELKQKGKTILYTTHYMEEAERFSDRIGIIDSGHIVATGTFAQIKQNINVPDKIQVSFEGELGPVQAKLAALKSSGGVAIEGQSVLMDTNDFKNDLKTVVMLFNECDADIVHIEKKEVNLETIFLKLTGKNLRD